MKIFESKDDNIYQKKVLYRAGVVTDLRKTPSGNTVIMCKDIERVNTNNGLEFIRLRADSNFLVPKRRISLTEKVWKEIKPDVKYIFRLEQETISEKYCVTEVFGVKNNG